MNGNGHTDIEDLAMYALLLLDGEETARVRDHLQGCDVCRQELGKVREDLAVYALTVDPVAVPEDARTRWIARLGDEAAQGSGSGVVAPEPGSLPVSGAEREPARPARSKPILLPQTTPRGFRVMPWLGWAAAAIAIVTALSLKQDRDALRAVVMTQNQEANALQEDVDRSRRLLGTLTDPHAVRVNLTIPKAPATPAARATYQQATGTLLLLASNMAPVAAHQVYELWLIPADGGKPVPAGTFRPDAHGNGSLLVPSLRGAVAAKAFGITLEDDGGSVTPTMPILLVGTPA